MKTKTIKTIAKYAMFIGFAISVGIVFHMLRNMVLEKAYTKFFGK